VQRQILGVTLLAAGAAAAAGCGEMARQGNSAYQLTVRSISATSGATGDSGAFLNSDVETFVDNVATVFSDTGTATVALIAKNPTGPAPTPLNAVTINRYRITFRRSDGRNTPGVDVPQPVEGAVTATVQGGGTADVAFDFIRHVAKQEPPLRPLRRTAVMITTVADVTFFGRDQTGRDASASGSIGVTFGDFGDPN